MTYFKINEIDYSMYVNKLLVGTEHIYKGRTNASGNTVVKRINTKRTLEVGIIPLDDFVMSNLQYLLNNFTVTVTFLDPATKRLETIKCMVSVHSVDYYTIQDSDVRFKAFSLTFKEL